MASINNRLVTKRYIDSTLHKVTQVVFTKQDVEHQLKHSQKRWAVLYAYAHLVLWYTSIESKLGLLVGPQVEQLGKELCNQGTMAFDQVNDIRMYDNGDFILTLSILV